MKVKVAEASGVVLDYMVARCDQPDWTEEDALLWIQDDEYRYHPSTNWSQGGPIIEREELHWGFGGMRDGKRNCLGQKRGYWQKPTLGPTPLIAAMRCYTSSRLGEEVEVPDELLET